MSVSNNYTTSLWSCISSLKEYQLELEKHPNRSNAITKKVAEVLGKVKREIQDSIVAEYDYTALPANMRSDDIGNLISVAEGVYKQRIPDKLKGELSAAKTHGQSQLTKEYNFNNSRSDCYDVGNREAEFDRCRLSGSIHGWSLTWRILAITFLCMTIVGSLLGVPWACSLSHEVEKEKLKKFMFAKQEDLFLCPLRNNKSLGHIGVSHEDIVNNRKIGVAHLQGDRPDMQDDHIATQCSVSIGNVKYNAEVYGIFDGHGKGGEFAAGYCREHFSKCLESALQIHNPDGLSEEGIFMALKTAFIQLHENFKRKQGGTTAVVAIILDGNLWVANVGDSRVVLNNGGEAIQLSEDQTLIEKNPNGKALWNTKYIKGVRKNGGWISKRNPRDNNSPYCVGGRLIMPRAIGDRDITGLVHNPKITKTPLTDLKPKSSLIIACDGLWDEVSSTQVAQYVHTQSVAEDTAHCIAERLVVKAYQAGSTDNISAMVIPLHPLESSPTSSSGSSNLNVSD